MHTTTRKYTDPTVLRAIVDLEARGWTRREIMELLGFVTDTYYRCKAEIRRRARAAKGPEADDR
jgi:tRNA G26 N,N-dimethylase Trm1